MKSFINPSYTFTPGASGVGTVNLSGISNFDVKYLVSIINQTRGQIIYATGTNDYKYTNVAGTTVTLFYSTTGMSSGDVLQVIYETDNPSVKTLATALVSTDKANVNQSVIHGLSSGGGGTYVDVKVDPTGKLLVDSSGSTASVTNFPLGSLTKANSLSFTLASDEGTLPVSFGLIKPRHIVAVDASSTSIPASSGSTLQIVASTTAQVSKIVWSDDIGEVIGLYTGGIGSEILVGYFAFGGNTLDVNIPAATRISIKNYKNTTITSGIATIHLIG